ncbi:7919_t:CDS:1, partial [Cetraspora pellucida]
DCDTALAYAPNTELTSEPDTIYIEPLTKMQLQLDQQAQLIQQLQTQVQSLQDTNAQILQFFQNHFQHIRQQEN